MDRNHFIRDKTKLKFKKIKMFTFFTFHIVIVEINGTEHISAILHSLCLWNKVDKILETLFFMM